ncbi:transposase [Streptomyces sp. enrichment culture]|uniref:transposase n=2 Tax=Streptomyces sp. enrichment culture TaxID=1795815 RepID=UPI003F569EB8
MTQAVVEVGARLRYEGRVWTLAVLEGARATLVSDEGASAVVLLPYLFADPSFEVEGGTAPGRVPPFGLLEALPEQVRERALAWQRHVREVETGFPDAIGQGAPREQFDPATRSLAQRERSKAKELSAAGWSASTATVRRMRARYRSEGLWGLVDGRAVRERSAVGRADERVVAAVRKVLEGQRERSTGTLGRLRRRVGWLLEEEYGPGVVALPPASTFNRLVRAVADGQGLLGTAAQRRWHASRPAPPFTPTVALRPGELVMLDSTPLDVLAVLDDGVTGRLELSIALDVATRSICAAVLRPVGTTSVDAAMLLAQMVVPTAMRPGWDKALSMQRSVIPYERLVALDARLEQAAARPVIMPETVIVDQGRVYVSASFVSACESLGISVQPVPPANGPAKGNVERTFRAIADGFSQYLPGHTGSDVSQRGAAAEQDACWSLAQLQELLDEWVICGWQERRHEALRHPMMPKVAVCPNEMWAALVAVTGHVPVPLSADDYVELLPVRWQAVNDYGIRFGYRTYDHPGLNPYRRRRSLRADKNGRWEVHHNPYDPNRVWVRLPEGWLEVPWVHAGAVRRPFTAFTFDHVRRTVQRREGREEHEAAIAQALDTLLRRASQGLGSRRERTVAARAQAAAQMTDPSPATAPQPWPAPLAPGASFGLPGSFTVPLEDGDGWDTDDSLDDIEDNQDDEDYLLAALADGQDAAAGHADEAEPSEPTAETTQDQAAERTLDAAGAGGMRIYDPYQEAQAW